MRRVRGGEDAVMMCLVYIMVMKRVRGGEDVRMSVTVGGLGQWWWWW